MKLVEEVVKVALFIAGCVLLVFVGWMLRGYKARKETK